VHFADTHEDLDHRNLACNKEESPAENCGVERVYDQNSENAHEQTMSIVTGVCKFHATYLSSHRVPR